MTSMTTTQQQTLGPISFKDRKGNQAPVEDISWASSDESVVRVVPSDDNLSADVVAQGPGSATVNVNADAQIGEGVQPLIGTKDYTITQGVATVIEIPEGAVTEQP